MKSVAQHPPTYAADVPDSILTPDLVKTERLGDLNFFDGLPSEETVKKVYDYLDTARGVDAFLNGMPAASIYAFLEGMKEAGMDTYSMGITEGLIDGIQAAGECLASHFPYDRSTDVNELSDEIDYGRR